MKQLRMNGRDSMSYKRKLGSWIIVIHLVLFLLFPLASITARENPANFGIGVEDGTAIQVYFEEEAIIRSEQTTVKIKVPQDTNLLEFDYFYLYVDVRDDEPRFVTVEYYTVNETSSGQFEPLVLLLQKTFRMNRGNNEWRDPRFAEIRVDGSNFFAFTQTDVPRMFVITYQELKFYFIHLTNPALVEEPVTRAEFTATIVFYGFQAFMFFTIAMFLASRVKNKLNTWVKFDFATVALIITWIVIGGLGVAIAAGLSQYDLLRQLIQIPASTVFLIMSLILGLWVPGFFTIKPSKLHVLKVDSINVDLVEIIKNYVLGQAVKDPKKFIDVGYEHLEVVKTDHGKRYYRKSQSLIELLGSIIHGTTAIISTERAFSLEVNLETEKKYKKSYYERIKDKIIERTGDLGFYLTESQQNQEILLVIDMRWKKTKFGSDHWLLKIIDDFKVMTVLFAGISLAIFVVLATFRQSIDFVGSFAVILGTIYFLYFVYDYTKKYKYLEIDPLPRSALQVIYDSQRVFESERVISTQLTALKDENVKLRMKLNVVGELEKVKEDILSEKVLFPANYEEFFKDKEKEVDKVIKEIRGSTEELEEKTEKQKGGNVSKGGQVA